MLGVGRTIPALAVALLGTATCVAAAQSHTAAPARTPAGNAPAFGRKLREVAAHYRLLRPVYQAAKWAPEMCAAPPAVPKLSRAPAGSGHGRKLYYLFTGGLAAYKQAVSKLERLQPVGQVLVKESWIPRRAAGSAHGGDPAVVKSGTQAYLPGTKGPLFVMLKLDPRTKETDQGWVYGTLTPDGRTVTSAGRVAACMRCHQQGTHDRLFGPRGGNVAEVGVALGPAGVRGSAGVRGGVS
jgi:hypothetical protein